MFDIAPTELLLVAFVALVVIGPKDLPKAMRIVGYWVGRARGVARQFRSGFDAMVREAELEEMEKKWAAENERIMREHPATPSALPDETPDRGLEQAPDHVSEHVSEHGPDHGDATTPVMVERPHVVPDDGELPSDPAPGRSEGAAS